MSASASRSAEQRQVLSVLTAHDEPVAGRTIMLDVDGVLGATIVRHDGEIDARVSGEVIARVQALAALAPITWATSWSADVRARLGALLGFPSDTESLAIVPSADPAESKRRALERFLQLHEPDGGWRTVVWIDDGIRSADRDWASSSRWPLTLVTVDRRRLLSDDDVEAARRAFEAVAG